MVLISLPFHMAIGLFVFLMVGLSIIIWIINIPIFNYIVIPLIEKQAGRTLNFSFFCVYNNFLFGKFFARHAEIMKYVVMKYWALKFKKDDGYVRFSNQYAMQEVNFKIENAPSFVIFMCFFSALNYLVMMLGLCVGGAISLIYGVH